MNFLTAKISELFEVDRDFLGSLFDADLPFVYKPHKNFSKFSIDFDDQIYDPVNISEIVYSKKYQLKLLKLDIY